MPYKDQLHKVNKGYCYWLRYMVQVILLFCLSPEFTWIGKSVTHMFTGDILQNISFHDQ